MPVVQVLPGNRPCLSHCRLEQPASTPPLVFTATVPLNVWAQEGGDLIALLIVIGLLAVVCYLLAVALQKQRQLEAAARKQEREIRLLTETIPVVIFSVNPRYPESHFYLSGRFEALTGYADRAFKADPSLWRQVAHPDDQDGLRAALLAQQAGRRALDHEFRIVTRQGEIKWVRVMAVPAQDEAGEVTRIDGFLEDITARKEIEMALQEREAMLAKAEEMAGIGSYAWDLETDTLTWSDNMLAIAGLTSTLADLKAEDFAGRLSDIISTMVHPDDRERVSAELQQMIAQECTWPMEFRLMLPDGEIRTLVSDAQLIHDDDGKLTKVIGLHHDVTEWRAAEAAVTHMRDFYEQILETVQEGIWVVDAHHCITYVNRAAAEIFGIPKADLMGANLMSDFSAEALRYWLPIYERARTTLRPNHYEVQVRLPDGRAPYQAGWLVPLNQNGHYDGMIGTVQDVTQQREAGEALRRSEERFHRFMQYLPAAAFIRDADDRLLYANERFAEIVGAPLDGLLAGDRVDTLPEDILNRYLAENHTVLEREAPLESESRYPTPAGPRDLLTYKFPIFQGEAPNLVGGISIDITERKQTEAQLRSALREKTVLLQEIHHRVKNNLAIVISLLGLQAMTVEDTAAQMALTDSQRRIHAMARVHEQLYRAPDLSSVDMVTYVRDLSRDLQASLGLDEIEFGFDVEPLQLDIGSAIPCALILNEFISNAIQHGFLEGANLRSPPQVLPIEHGAQPRVVIHLRRLDTQAEVAVYNNGRPLPDDFDIAKSESLGLTLVRLLVQQLEGTLAVACEAGTTFVVRFPLRERTGMIDG